VRKRTWKTELPPLIGVTIGQFVMLRLIEWAPAAAETDEIARVLVHFHFFYAPFILTAFFLFFAYRLVRTLVDLRGIEWGTFLRANAIYLLIALCLPVVGHLDQLISVLGVISSSYYDSVRSLREEGLYRFLSQNEWPRFVFDLVGVVLAVLAFRLGTKPYALGTSFSSRETSRQPRRPSGRGISPIVSQPWS
jgi:hypothetical protein